MRSDSRLVRRGALVAALTGAAAIGAASPVEAALPGRSGNIAVGFSASDRGGGFTSAISIFDPGGRGLGRFAECREDPTVPDPPAALPCPANPAYSPTGRRIAYDLGLRGQATRLAIANADGSSVRVLPRLTESDSQPAFSRGGRLAFTGLAAGRTNVYIANSDGGGLRQLTRIGGRTPAWSVRGRIAYVRAGRLYSVDPDGSDKKRLRRGDEPDYSPKGDRIVYQRTFNAGRQNEKTSLFILRSARRFRRLTFGSGLSPAWSPGGGSVAFERPAQESGSSLMTVRTNRTGLRVVARGDLETAFSDPSWQSLR